MPVWRKMPLPGLSELPLLVRDRCRGLGDAVLALQFVDLIEAQKVGYVPAGGEAFGVYGAGDSLVPRDLLYLQQPLGHPVLRGLQVVLGLQAHPELGRVAKETGEQ